jgi:hypothetical protein
MCKKKGIEESERCVPVATLRARKKAAKEKGKPGQAMVQTRITATTPKVFDRLGLLKTITIHIATTDQVSSVPPNQGNETDM